MSYNLGNTDAITYDGAEVDKLTLNGETIWESGAPPAQSEKLDTLYWYQLYGGYEPFLPDDLGISRPKKIPLGGYIDGQDGANGGYYKNDIAVKFDAFKGTDRHVLYNQIFLDISSWIPDGSTGIKSLRVSTEDANEVIMVDNSGQVFSKSKSGKLRGDGVLERRLSFEEFKVQEFDGGHPKYWLPHTWAKQPSFTMGPLTLNGPGKFGYSSDHVTLPNWSGFSSSTDPSGLYQDGGVQLPATGGITNAHSITGYTHENSGGIDGFFINSDEGVFATSPLDSGTVRFSRYGAIQGFAYDDPTLWTGSPQGNNTDAFVTGIIVNPMSKVTSLGLSFPEKRRTFAKSLTGLKDAIESYGGEVTDSVVGVNSIGKGIMATTLDPTSKSTDFKYYSMLCGSFGGVYLFRDLDGATHEGWYGFDWYGGFRFSESAKKVFSSGDKRLLGYLPFKGDLYSPEDSSGLNLVLLYEGDRQLFFTMPPDINGVSCSAATLQTVGFNRENIRHPRSGQIFIKPSGTFKVNDNYTYTWTSKSAYWHWHDKHVEKWDSLMDDDGLIPSDGVYYVKAKDEYRSANAARGADNLPRLESDASTADTTSPTTVNSWGVRQPYQVASKPVGSFAMVVGDTFWAWGENWHGELGIGDYAHLHPDADDGDWVADETTGWIKKRLLSTGAWKEEPKKNASGDYTHFVRYAMWGNHLYQPVYVKYDHDGNEIKGIKDIAVCNQGILILKTDGTLLASGRFWKPIAYCDWSSTSINTMDTSAPSLGSVLETNTPSLVSMNGGAPFTRYPAPIYPSRFEDTGLVDIEAVSAASLTAIIVQKAGSASGYLWELGYETLTSTQTINSNKTGNHVTGI